MVQQASKMAKAELLRKGDPRLSEGVPKLTEGALKCEAPGLCGEYLGSAGSCSGKNTVATRGF